MPVQRRIKRKYYKRCLNQHAWRFAPTGALQPAEKLFIQQIKHYFVGKEIPARGVLWTSWGHVVTKPLEYKENEQ